MINNIQLKKRIIKRIENMSTDNFLKIPSLLQFSSSSLILNDVMIQREEYDEESPKLDKDDIGMDIEKEVRRPSVSIMIPNISFVSNLLKASPMAKVEDTRPLKKMITKEEMEAETKIATQKAMIQLGEQIAEKRFTEKMEQERRRKFEELFEEYVMEKEELEKTDLEDWINDHEDELKSWGFYKKMNGRDLFAKLIFSYSYLKMDMEKEKEKNEQLEETIDENNEQMEEYIKEIEEKENILECKDKTIELQSHSIIRLNHKLNEEFKNDYFVYFGILFLVSHILSLTIQRYGLFTHLWIIIRFGDIILDIMEMTWSMLNMMIQFIIGVMMHSNFVYGMILLMAGLQMFHFCRKGYDSFKNYFISKKKKKND